VRIATIGAGAMAEALGTGWTEAGHEVLVTARSPERAAALAARVGGRVRAGNLREAAAFGEVILLAVPGEAATDALPGPAGLVGRVGGGWPGGRGWPDARAGIPGRFGTVTPVARLSGGADRLGGVPGATARSSW
jgi:hypothetical protein